MEKSTVLTTEKSHYTCPEGLEITGDYTILYEQILSYEALVFIKALHGHFNAHRIDLLNKREKIQSQIDQHIFPDFLEETKLLRENEWTVAPVPKDLQDRRVEITGPVERKMIINALNSGARIFMADFEDSNSPSWRNIIEGQINLRDAINKTISYSTEGGKKYVLNKEVATLMVRPRGWHLHEKHVKVHGEYVSAGIFDFGLYFYHNVKTLLKNTSGPYFYLPKLENHSEARVWNEVFVFAQNYLNIPQGTIKATVLIETILAPFQLHEILWELRNHSAGLNCGRWDYIFSFIKKFRNQKAFIFPERGQITMTVPFMRAYTQLVIQTCHKRGIHAIGGMAAQIPIKNNEEENKKAIAKVTLDKLREVTDGHDGTWVAHPGLVSTAMDIFNLHMKQANQIATKKREDFSCTAEDLLRLPEGTITEEGMRMNINVGILYLESWLRGNGAAALYNLMEDAATAEISRTQIWQWIQNKSQLSDGRFITKELYESFKNSEIAKIKKSLGEKIYSEGKFAKAIELFNTLVLQESFEEFLTVTAYDFIN
ncbi:malate synthase A [Sphingobacteriaceae bacterium]|nr:malate synthase A [Sphingobacteriaceae bacterium]